SRRPRHLSQSAQPDGVCRGKECNGESKPHKLLLCGGCSAAAVKAGAPDRAISACRPGKPLVKDEPCIPFIPNIAWMKAEIDETLFRRIVVRPMTTHRILTLIIASSVVSISLAAAGTVLPPPPNVTRLVVHAPPPEYPEGA